MENHNIVLADVRLGFIGLGHMGLPMCRRLLSAGHTLHIWNRSPDAVGRIANDGAVPSASPAELFEACDVVLLSLANEAATEAVLGRECMNVPVAGRTVIQLGTTSPAYSRQLADAVSRRGGRYIEAPVSGSKQPAENGTLIGMLGATREYDFQLAEQLLSVLTAATYRCGPPGAAMTMKLAVNSYLIAMVMSLAESWAFARRLGLDASLFREILDAGPMASAASRGKLAKLVANDMNAQASIADVLMNAQLVADLARLHDHPLALGEAGRRMLERAVAGGHGADDMIAVAGVLWRNDQPEGCSANRAEQIKPSAPR